MLKNFSLKTRIFALVSSVVIVAFLVLTVIVSSKSYTMAKNDAFHLAQETADKYKNEIVAELQGARITAETLSTVFETLKDYDLTDRDMMNDILKNALADKEYITAFCIAYDPNALDGKDAEFAGLEPLYDSTGRYAPYWNKLGGNIDVEYLPDIDAEDWYIVPKTELHEYITDPYPYGLQGQTVMLASLIFPILHDGKFIGIISSDIVLDKLQEMVSKVNPHEQGGYTEIFSNSGTIVAHPDEALLGVDLTDAMQQTDPELAGIVPEIKSAIQNGEIYLSASQDSYTVYMPIQFSEATNPWSVAVSVPMSKVLANANAVRNYAIMVSLIAIVLIACILYVIARNVTKPILILSDTAKILGDGDFDVEIEAPLLERSDEIGTLSKAFRVMAEKIHEQIIEMQKYTQSLEVAMTESMAANEAKSLFLANMSHEIRTPLNAVIGLSNLLLDTSLDDKQKDYTEKMRRSSTTLLGIVNDILDFSKAEAGDMKLDRVSFDVRRIFDDLSVFFEEQNADSGIALRFELDPSLPDTLVGDPLRLQQIFINLVDNAYKFTEKGAITIRASVTEQGQNDVKIRFAVEDTGIGIGKDQMEKIFAAFSQADNSSSRKYGGMGIGLTITQQMVELMGGDISVVSAAGKGTTFTFTCPFWLPAVASESEVHAAAIAAEDDGENAILHGLRVLLVEDNDINAMISVELLKAVGIEVRVAENGKIALEKLAEAQAGQQQFDIVLMDLQMPIMDGYEATRIMKETAEYEDIPVLALTAHAFPEERERCIALGMEDRLTKPIDMETFYEALRKVAGKKI
jgi:signal transduction histidine kinase/CheY-like chemotaxis protein